MIRSLTSSRRRLLALLGAVGVLAIGGAIAGAALAGSDSGPKPPPRPLAQAVLGALQAQPVDGITAKIRFTNRLLPAGSLPKDASVPFGAGADGRLWLSRDGRMRLDLRSDAGDLEITADGRRVRLFDARSNTISSFALPKTFRDGDRKGGPGALGDLAGDLGPLLSMWNLSGATPTSTAGRPSYTVRISPRDDGGLLGAAELAWDADHGVPLRAAVYVQGESDPVLELAATEIDYGPVAPADLEARPHRGARVVEVDPAKLGAQSAPTSTVSGVDAVRRRLDFPLAAPPELAGLPRRSVHLVRSGGAVGAVSVYGRGLGAIVVWQTEAGTGPSSPLGGLELPQVNIDGRTGTELATALGTVVSFERDGVSYTVLGSVPPVAAENAARGLR
jgi:hypothetical protein